MIGNRHGTLERIKDTEHRPLRPIGAGAREVAERTGRLLTGLLRMPGVRLYQGVRLGGQDPPLPYALTARSRVVLVETVAWPPGDYTTGPGGEVLCGDVYIGQSAHLLAAAVRRLRRLQPRGHRVGGVVVVHPSLAGPMTLPAGSGIMWVRADDAVRVIGGRLLRGGSRPVPSRAVAALADASAPRAA